MQKVAISQYPRNAGSEGGNVMGYSIRNERWRATFWRQRGGEKIVATELYDEKNDPNETASIHDRPENAAVIESLKRFLPDPSGSAVIPKTAMPEKSGQSAPNEDRGARFDRLYPGKSALTLEEYLAKQGDKAAATQRFEKFDTNNDAVVTRDEFIGSGSR
ncbi:MAG: hypothetical protein KDA68_15765 [Planctomycetaceae bacterium]|nr:hypothetical protein [Planctomycetaceae bacterium]